MMEQRMKTMDTALLLESYRDLLQTVEMLPLVVTGNSMLPFLVHKRDAVYLTKIKKPLKVGDMVLYQRLNGEYILHRICRIKDKTYCMVGDAQTVIEPDIKEEQLIAVVCKAQRKGKVQKPGCFWWFFFENIWVRMIPCRPVLQRLYGVFHQCFRRK